MNYNNNPPDYMYNNGPTFGGIAGPAYELEQPNNIYSTNKGGTNVPRGGNSLVSLGGPNGYDNSGKVQRVKNVATHGGQINNLDQNINNESNTLGNFYYNSNNNCLGCTQSTENLTNNVTNNEKLNKTNNNNLSENNKTNYVSY